MFSRFTPLVRAVTAAVGGMTTYLGYAPSTWWWAPIVGFGLLGLSVSGVRARWGALLGFLFGAALFLPMLVWSGTYVGDVPWVALSLAEAALVAPATAVMAALSRLPGRGRRPDADGERTSDEQQQPSSESALEGSTTSDSAALPGSGQVAVWWPAWAAAAWVTGEVIRAVFPFGGFPWGTVAFTQPDGPLLPLVAIVGESGLSFAVALTGFTLSVVAQWCRRRIWPGAPHGGATVARDRARPGVALAIVIALGALPALLSLPAASAAVHTGAQVQTAPIAVIQGNVPEPGLEFNARRRAVTDLHGQQTAALAADIAAGRTEQPVAVIWPENASDIDPYRNADAAEVISAAAASVGVPILVGAVVQADQPRRVYNMGIVWDPVSGPGDTYTKRHPVPFGEYIPWRPFFRFFSDKVDLVQSEFLPGDKPGNLNVGGVAIGDVICFEVVEEGLVRDVVNGGAEVLVVQTNNATFGYSNETYQQQAMSRVRAVEFGRSVLIAATSGVSAVIRPDGSVESTIGLFTAGYSLADVPLLTHRTAGTVVGEPLRWIISLVAPGLLLVRWLLSRVRAGRSGSTVSGKVVDESVIP